MKELFMFGAPGEIRTPDRSVRSRVLYPAELRARKVANLTRTAVCGLAVAAVGVQSGQFPVIAAIGNADGLAAYLAVFNVILLRNRQVQQYVEAFPAVRAGDNCFFLHALETVFTGAYFSKNSHVTCILHT